MVNTENNKFRKSERLCSTSLIDQLFDKGRSANAYPVKVVFLVTELQMELPAQAMFVVPKRIFKRSPDRNILRRRMKEAYRLSKASFYSKLAENERKVLIAFIYTAKKQEEYKVINKAIMKILKELPDKF